MNQKQKLLFEQVSNDIEFNIPLYVISIIYLRVKFYRTVEFETYWG